MLLNPAILALFLVSAVISLMMLIAGGFALQIIRYWDIGSGSEKQLQLERRTYLIATLLSWAFLFELISLLLFVYNAEAMSGQFVGAMCATGVLNVNVWGWPTLYLKIIIFFIAAIWLALNFMDNKGFDYPLVRVKYFWLLLLVPLVLAEFVVQSRYFLQMNPDVITSCCGSLFSDATSGVSNDIASITPGKAMALLYGSGFVVMISGTWSLYRKSGNLIFGLFSVLAFVAALISIIAYVSPYIYEHPHHHCPFCILKSGHSFAGYTLYIPLFGATAFALCASAISLWKNISSIADEVLIYTPRWTFIALTLFTVFYAFSTYWVLHSSLTMQTVWW